VHHDVVGVDERGYRVGQTHHNSTIPDSVVRAVRDAHEYDLWSYNRIAREMGLKKSTVAKLCRYERRAIIAQQWRRTDKQRNRQTTSSPANE
jgi:ribosome-binding protein aMBF1 (putative translation factor)